MEITQNQVLLVQLLIWQVLKFVQKWGGAVDKSNSVNEVVGDLKGGFHEEGGSYGESNGKEIVVEANPGKANMELKVGTKATINTTEPANPESVPSDYQITGTYHVHPSGVKNKKGFAQGPSPQDVKVSGNTTVKGKGNHYILGARSQKVYIYNSSGTIATFPLSTFRK